jgi:hypothetical protein
VRAWLGAALLVACTGNGIGKLCGGPGQPCCVGNTCESGAQCNLSRCQACGAVGQPCCGDSCASARAICDGTTCRPCGAVGESCCASAVCSDDLACRGTCAQRCVTTCNAGATRCAGAGLEICVVVDACPTWLTLVGSCPAGSSCVAANTQARCVDPCPGRCRVGSTECTPDGLARCTANGPCPALIAETERTSFPQCLSTATLDATLRWESPAPFRNSTVALSADQPDQLWLLDGSGNIIRRNGASFNYELRADTEPGLSGLVSCGVGRLMAFGAEGKVAFRQAGGWVIERAGRDRLVGGACRTLGPSFGVTASGELFEKPNSGAWQRVWSGTTGGAITTLAYNGFDDEVVLLGRSGTALVCRVNAGARGCQPESTGITQDFLASWVDVPSGVIFAAGTDGLLAMRRLNGWQTLPSGTTSTFRALSGQRRSAGGNPPRLVAVGDEVTLKLLPGVAAGFLEVVPGVFFRGVDAPSTSEVVAVSSDGTLFSLLALDRAGAPVALGQHPTTRDIHGVTAIGDERVVAVGEAGLRLERSQGAWRNDESTLPLAATLHAVAAVSPDEVYAAGAAGTIVVRRFGTWQAETSGILSDLRGLAASPNLVVAVGDQGVWLSKTPGSATWRAESPPAAGLKLSAVAMERDGAGQAVVTWAVGQNCLLLRKRGDQPIERLAVTGAGEACRNALETVHVTGADVIFGGDEPFLFRFSSGAFSAVSRPEETESVHALTQSDATLWAIIGTTLCRFNSQWACDRHITDRQLTGLTSAGASGLFVVGDDGVILRRP